MEVEILKEVMELVTAFLTLIVALISLIVSLLSYFRSRKNELRSEKIEDKISKQKDTISNLDGRSNEIERNILKQKDTISKLDESIKSSSRTSGSDLAKFYRSDRPVVVDDGIKVAMVSPSLGKVCGNVFSWANDELSKWRDDAQYKGKDAKGYYMELEIDSLQEGKPFLEIRPIRADYNAWWEQPLNVDASDPSNGRFVFDVYISPENRGFHLLDYGIN